MNKSLLFASLFSLLSLSGCSAARVNWAESRDITPQLPGACRVKITPSPNLAYAFYEGRGTEEHKAKLLETITQYVETDLNRTVFSGKGGPDSRLEVRLTFFGTRGLSSSYEMIGEARLYSGATMVGKYDIAVFWKASLMDTANVARCEEWAVFNYVEELKARIAKNLPEISGKIQGGGGYSAKSVPAGTGEGGLLTIAVSDLSAEGVSQSNASIVADWLRGALVTTGTYTVVERSAMQKILSEQAFQNTGCTSSDCAVKLGKVLNVKKMVVGSFGKFLDSYVLNVRVVDVESGQVVYSDSAKGKTTDEVEENIKSLAQRLSR